MVPRRMRAPHSDPLRFRRRHTGRWMLLAALLVGGTALAYVLPGSSVLRRMVTARAEQQVSQLTAKGTLTLEDQVRDQLARHLGLVLEGDVARVDEIGRASCRERVDIWEGGGATSIQRRR